MSRSALTALALLVMLSACRDDSTADAKGDAADDDNDGEMQEDRTPLSFDLQAPEDARFTEEASLVVNGTVGGVAPAVTVNGASAAVEAGTWTTTADHGDVAWPDSPLFPILGEAMDDDGSWLRDRVTLAVGQGADTSDPIVDAIGARLTDHAFVAFDPLIEQAVSELDINELLVSSDPVASILGGDLYIDAASMGAIGVDLDFTGEGLRFTLAASNLAADLRIDFGWFDTDAELTVERVDVVGVVRVDVVGGELEVTPVTTTVDITDVELFGLSDPTGTIDDLLVEELSELLEEEIVELTGDLLTVLDDITELELSGLVLETSFTSSVHDEDGLTLLADTVVRSEDAPLPALRFANPLPMPALSGSTTADGAPYSLALFLDDDLLSAIGAGLMSSGVLEQEVGGDLGSITLDTTLLGASVPGFDTLPAGEDVTLSLAPTLTPIGTAGAASPEAGRLHLGGLLADFRVPSVQADPVMTVALDAILGVGLGEETLLDVEVVDTRATLLSTTLGSTPAEVEPGVQALIGLAVPLLIGDLLGDSLDFSDLPVEVVPVASGPVDDRAALFLDIGDVSGLEL